MYVDSMLNLNKIYKLADVRSLDYPDPCSAYVRASSAQHRLTG